MLADNLKNAPRTTGVYLFLEKEQPIYIGKAVNLKARLLAHFHNRLLDRKEKLIFQKTDRIKTMITDSEFNALLLEASLIKKYQPKYNVVWKDSKTPLYIKVTIKDPYPKIVSVRQENDGRSLYFGPFGSSRLVNRLLREIRKIMPFCTQKKEGPTPCFYSKIGLCQPCPTLIEKTTDPRKQKLRRAYLTSIRRVILLLQGRSSKLLRVFATAMNRCRRDEDYENALYWRDKIDLLKELLQDRSFHHTPIEDSIKNRLRDLRRQTRAFLASHFGIKKTLGTIRIECFDASHLFGGQAVGSMVVFVNGVASKKDYRRFKIKRASSTSDLDMIREIFRRRLKRTDWPKPDLIVVDGGRPQLRVLDEVLTQNKILIPHIGFAKNPDRLVFGQSEKKAFLPKNSALFLLLTRIRDESHRFAKKYHLLLRKKQMMI